MSNADRLALCQAHAGEPVNSFRLDRSFTWTSLGDDGLAEFFFARTELSNRGSGCPGLGGQSAGLTRGEFRTPACCVRDGSLMT